MVTASASMLYFDYKIDDRFDISYHHFWSLKIRTVYHINIY